MPRISILVPCFNEESTVSTVISEYDFVLKSLVGKSVIRDYEILVLDDGSYDASVRSIKSVSTATPKLNLIELPKNSGLASAFRKLYENAAYEWFFIAPADNQWPAEAFEYLMADWAGGEAIVAVREHRLKDYTFVRKLVSFCFNLLANVLVGQNVGDAGAPKLCPTSVVHELELRSPVQEIEILIRLKAANVPIRPVITPTRSRVAGESTGSSARNVVKSIAEIARLLLIWCKLPKNRLPGQPRAK